MKLRVAKWGDDLALRFPASVARQLGLSAGRRVDAPVTTDGTLVIRPADWCRSAFAAELDAAHAELPMGASVIDAVCRERVDLELEQLAGIAKGAKTHSLRDREDR